MGQLSLIFVLALVLITGVVLFNTTRAADRADDKVWEHQHRVLARDAASTGMAITARKMGESVNNPGWVAHPDYPFTATNVAYNGGSYSVETFYNECSILTSSNRANALASPLSPYEEIMEVRSVGQHSGGATAHRHEIRGCYVRTNWGLFSPPAFNYGFISGGNATFNGGTFDSFVDGEGHIHGNSNVTIRPQTVVQGHVTYTGDGNVHHNATVASHTTGAHVPLPPFSASDFKTNNNIPEACTANPQMCRYNSSFTADGNAIIAPPTAPDNYGKDNPYIWFIDGDFTLTGNSHITVPQYTIIVVNGNISVGGSSSITATGVKAPTCNDCPEAQHAWVQSQMLDGESVPLAWYGTGNATLGGSGSVIGNFYVNGNVTLNGGGTGMNSVGSFAAGGSMTVNGGAGATRTNFWFVEIADTTVVDEVMLPGKQIVRYALAEWTEPVIANSN